MSTIRETIDDNYLTRNVVGGLKIMLNERTTTVYFSILVIILLLGLVGPAISPYEYDEYHYDESGQLLIGEPPSVAHPLGTTDRGYDVLSRILYGARPTVITGLLGGTMIIGIGATVGLVSGYVGGRTDDVLMRFTDMVYSIPLLPFAIVLVGFLGAGFIESIVAIGLILWRGSARVIRSQVLQIKERPFVVSTKATGASTPRIIIRHILPNVATMAVMFFAIGVGYTIILQAGLAFLGVSSPFVPSWGIMIRNAYESGMMATAWWWSMTPGFLLGITVLSTFMFGRNYEKIAGQGNDEAFVSAG